MVVDTCTRPSHRVAARESRGAAAWPARSRTPMSRAYPTERRRNIAAMGSRRDLVDEPLHVLVDRARQRDDAAWAELVRRLERVVWKAVNVVTADDQLRRDAFAATWLRLAERLTTIRDPERLPGWLATTAAREALALSRRERRYTTFDPAGQEDPSSSRDTPDEVAVRRDGIAVVRAALAELDDTCRELLTALIVTDPPMTYAEVAEHFGRPHGWIGPTRERCLAKLRRDESIAALSRGGHDE
jgi:RNA polymerase sigma factor (sigma-70 family)